MNSRGSESSFCQSSIERSHLSFASSPATDQPERCSALAARLRLLVDPVRGDAELGHLVHLVRADLDLQRPALGPDHGRVQRLVHVELGHRDEVLEAARQRLPQRVDHADRAVAVLDRVDDHAHRGEVVDLVELAALLGHLRVDRVEVLGAARRSAPRCRPRRARACRYSPASDDVALALVALLGDQALDLLVLARVQRREREVLELPLDRVDTQAVRQRRVDLERLARLLHLLLLRHRVDRAHVVQAVGELDQDDPHVGGHRDHHLAVVVRLRLVARLEGDAGQLRDAVDDRRDLLAEALAHLLDRRRGVLDRVVQQRRAQRLGVQAHARADPRHADRVHDEVLARLAPLVGVVLAGEHERVLHARAVDLDRRSPPRARRRSRTGRSAAAAPEALRLSAAGLPRRDRGASAMAMNYRRRELRRAGLKAASRLMSCEQHQLLGIGALIHEGSRSA